MDTIDRFDSNLPVPFSAASSLPSGLVPAFSRDLATTPSFRVNQRVILRGLTRHWWHILLLWLGVSLPVAYLISQLVGPTYVAFSTLRVEAKEPTIFAPGRQDFSDSRSVGSYLQTQVNLITSDRVLGQVVANPLVVKLPVITESKDPKADLRKKIIVESIDGTSLIRVALELSVPEHAATIVNAVVQSYLEFNKEYERSTNSTHKASLTAQLVILDSEIKKMTGELRALYKKGTVEVAKPSLTLSVSKSEDDTTQPTISSITEEHHQRLVDEMVRTDLALIEAQAILEVRQAANRAHEEENAQRSQQADTKLDDRIREEFKKDPAVVALIEEIAETKEHLDGVKAKARQANDPARRAAEKKHKKLTDEYAELWDDKYDEIKKRLQVAVGRSQSDEAINELKIRLEALQKKKEEQAKLFEKMKVEKKMGNNDTFEATFLHYEVNSLLASKEKAKANLQQLEFEASQGTDLVALIDSASVPKTPTNSKLYKYMAAAPVGILLVVLGLFLLLEIKAERVDDPDALSTCVRSEVYALPPLPTTRSIRKMSVPEADDQIEQFIQRLDHLRFGICGNPAELGKGRCVLITSAIGGEGKTTLAAQLALRCGNAGMSTLLIDADLRRAALCRVLDVPEGPGLSDVLKEEATIDEVVIPVQDGKFFLLPAGTAIKDTSRVLQKRNFALLITQVRQLYDLIIIDSPPVLPVPDALIVGRWADGAVLAARYDISRFPQVERARRQLDSAGIAILGTVINGMRHSESYYGRYRYSRQRSSQPKSSNAI
ncbi:MAG: polysaccharide biosynthesis tyrosine autokinase [Isosphaerales bacterium]